ncbi:MAG: hypothetical protein JWL95_3328 [Gemmatimonadetes bacterium]|nr:hypothetical protein [Gemmatimonadota bacterium]
MARTGRPSDLTPETVKRIADAIRGGADRITAARYGGVHRSTLARWMNKGRKQRRGEFKDFCDAIDAAEAEFVVQSVALVTIAGRGRPARIDPKTGAIIMPAQEADWRAAAWLLERRARKQYGRVDRLKVGGDKVSGPVVFELDVGSPVTTRRREQANTDAAGVPE